jgi:hypothetical protein
MVKPGGGRYIEWYMEWAVKPVSKTGGKIGGKTRFYLGFTVAT